MNEREKNVLDHIGRYTITIKKVLDELFFEGRTSQNLINKLTREKLIESYALDGKFRYYQLTSLGAKSRGIPPNRAREKEPKGIANDLGALWFSSMGEYRRKRLVESELKTLFGAPKGGNVVHVAQHAEYDSSIYRLYVPSDTSLLRSAIATIRKTAYDIVADERLVQWVERGTYRLAVLLHNESRKDELKRLILKENFPSIRIELEIAPAPSNLSEFINPDREEAHE